MTRKRIVIIGTGPVGLEAALYGRSLGHEVIAYDRGDVASSLAQWGFVRLFTPWKLNVTKLGLKALHQPVWYGPMADVCPSAAELRERYCLPLAASSALEGAIKPFTRVVSVGRDDFAQHDEVEREIRSVSPLRILLADQQGAERVEYADVVIDASGTYGNHRWAGRGGIPAPGERALGDRAWYILPDILGKDRAKFANKHTLLLGCGYSAATAINQLGALHRDEPETHCTWAIRRPGQALQAVLDDPLPARRQLVEASLKMRHGSPAWLKFLGHGVVEEFLPVDGKIQANLRCQDEDLSVQADNILALVGYMPDNSVYEQLQITTGYTPSGTARMASALIDDSLSDRLADGSLLVADSIQHPEPDFYILGAKSYGTNSNFLLRVGHYQVRDVYRLIDGESSPNLYA